MTIYRAGRRRPLPAKKSFKKLAVNEKEKDENSLYTVELDTQDLSGMKTRVQQHVDMFQYEEARDWCSRAILLAPEDADLRYQLGSICLELGDFQGGFENIRMSLNLEPETTPDRFFAFAQLIPGSEALEVYEYGLKVYEAQNAELNTLEVKRKVSTACCAAAEIFMTDLCDEVGAEVKCGEWLERAYSSDPSNAEVFRVRADLQVCQENPHEARESVLKACTLWSNELEKLMRPSEEPNELQMMTEFPSYESRISAAKILIELGLEQLGDKNLLEHSVALLEQLLKEDDSVLMTWYLLCLSLKNIDSLSSIDVLKDGIEGALRVARRDGFLKYPEMTTEDDLVQEILNWAGELEIIVDLDEMEREEAEGVSMDFEAALEEAERIDKAQE